MKWTKLTIDTTCEAEDLISAFLEEEGVLGVQIEDNIPLAEEEMETVHNGQLFSVSKAKYSIQITGGNYENP